MGKKAVASGAQGVQSAESQTLLHLDPAVIEAKDNTRFGLKQSRIESLSNSILAQGHVLEPVEVEAVDGGGGYRLTTGFYRHAAVTALNATGAGMTLPAIVRSTSSPVERTKRQLAENMERENQSPMDKAIAIKRLMDAGLSRMEVREIFATPGGRKGTKVQPASNSFLNIHLNMLELPKAIQTKIHEGLVGVQAAMELTRVPAERRAEVLERAESARTKALEQEEREEERLLAQEQKDAKAKEAHDKMQAEVMAASEDAKAAAQVLAQAGEAAKAAHTTAIGKHADAAAKKAAQKAFQEAEKVRVKAEETADAAQKVYETLNKKFVQQTTSQAEKAAKLKEARAKTPAVKGVSPTDVKKAANETGASTNFVPLVKAEIVKLVNALALPGGSPKVIAIAQVLIRAFAGEITESETHKELVKIVG
jgi:ParB/RepB/Spo0J family partition protein